MRPPTDPVTFIERTLIDPETGESFVLNDAERRFLRHAFERDGDGRLAYPELVYSAPKKSGKTGFAAMVMLYVVLVLGGRYAEGYAVANDLEQARGRVFQAVQRIVECSPVLAREAKVTPSSARIDFPNGATIQAIASDYAGAAGANPTITVFDELWAYTSEASRRLWDEMVPPPTRQVACRLTVTYAGFEGESVLLEELHARGTAGERIGPDLYAAEGQLTFWTHEPVAPWQTESWLRQMAGQLRRNAYLRMIENRFVSGESAFVDMDWWDACTDAELRPAIEDRSLPVFVGVDASVKHDSTAIVACAWDAEAKRVRVVWHRVFRPTPDEPLDFEATVEAALLDLRRRFRVREVRYDPFQMQATAQRAERAGVSMVEFAQSIPNLTEATTTLYELIKGRGLAVYPDDELRGAVQAAVARESTRGMRLAKDKAGSKIDAAVALSMAALGAVKRGQRRGTFLLSGGEAYFPAEDRSEGAEGLPRELPERELTEDERQRRRALFEAGWH